MTHPSDFQLNSASCSALKGIERGIEKEGLRFSPDGMIAQTGHPEALGSTLTHPSITTDYSEALLEFITPKLESIDGSLEYLGQLHSFALSKLGDERIWPASMPCKLNGEGSIPIARYGSSNVGKMKYVYRRGLEVRYGRIMQAIAGIHYNISFSETFWRAYQEELNNHDALDAFRSAQYFHLIRNFQRHSWLLYYLFGASPVVDGSFFDEPPSQLVRYGKSTWGLPYATSLRMSDLGYTNKAQQSLYVRYDSLKDYVETLSHAVHQPYEAYQKIGVKDAAGEYQQLNANILQIENEFYSEIRPKRVARSGERPVQALQRGGVEYIEIRALDINPFLPIGIDATVCRFLDAFALYCLLSNSAKQCPNEWAEIADNRKLVIKQGRQPDLEMSICGKRQPIQQWSQDILNDVLRAAELLDTAYANSQYTAAVKAQIDKSIDPKLLPSSQVMKHIEDGQEFFDLANQLSILHSSKLTSLALDKELEAELNASAQRSIAEQRQREAEDQISFEDYLEDYNTL